MNYITQGKLKLTTNGLNSEYRSSGPAEYFSKLGEGLTSDLKQGGDEETLLLVSLYFLEQLGRGLNPGSVVPDPTCFMDRNLIVLQHGIYGFNLPTLSICNLK